MIAATSLNVGLQRPFISIIVYFVVICKMFKCLYGLNKHMLSVCRSRCLADQRLYVGAEEIAQW